jgi:hypothetical protein
MRRAIHRTQAAKSLVKNPREKKTMGFRKSEKMGYENPRYTRKEKYPVSY